MQRLQVNRVPTGGDDLDQHFLNLPTGRLDGLCGPTPLRRLDPGLSCHLGHRPNPLLDEVGVGGVVVDQRPGVFLEHGQGVGQALPTFGRENRGVHQLHQPVFDGEKGRCEVAAVNRGHVTGLQRIQGADVVPVQQMAAIVFELFHGAKRLAKPDGQLLQPDVTQVVGGQRGQQQHADVGG